MTLGSPGKRVGYLRLIRTNRNFRHLWLGEMASWLGDWFNAIAMFTLVQALTGSPLALGLVFLTKIMPFAVASPFAGYLIDRFDRRRLMIAADLVRAVIVLGLVVVDESGEVYILYVLTILQVLVTAVFIPARSAILPNVVDEEELLTANSLSAATWSTILAVGAALGGFATAWLGPRPVFIIDSATYLVSAWFIFRTVIPHRATTGDGGTTPGTAWRDIVDGWRHLRTSPPLARMSLAKAAWSIAGGGLVYMLALLGEHLAAGQAALGIGILYAARGAGTGIGPVAVRAWMPDERRWPAMIGIGIAVCGLIYLIIGVLPWWGYWLALPVALAHAPSGANWVASTVLLQKRTEDRFRGRIFATEWLLMTLADGLSILAASLLLEFSSMSLRGGIMLFGALQLLCGLLWQLVIVPGEKADGLA